MLFLFIDDATNTCAGLTQGMCSTGNNVGADCSGDKCCFLDGQCMDPTATCVGGSPGTCSVTGEDCVSDECCTSGLGCLDSPLEITL